MVVNGPTKELSSIENMMNAKDDEEDVAAVATEEEEVVESASQYTERALEEFHKHSKLVRHEVPHIDSIQEGIELGEGGFAIVCAVDYDGQACAKKKLKDCILTGETTKFKIAAADLWKEADFLSSFQHDHIVSLKATHLSFEGDMKENFIVIDRLEKTLDQKIQEWNTKDQSFLNKPQMRLKLLHERIQVAMDICHTFQYLHDQNVIYRDLKAGNLGFDQDGKIKLFDFGLAKELKDDAKSSGGKYKLSGNTGSLAYMAPEVAKGWQYDKMVDVYSFGILLWEIVALRPAFANYTTTDDMHQVWSGDERPPMADWWPVELQWLMKKCWSYFSKSRPDFNVISETLDEILEEEEEDEVSSRGIKSFRFGSRRSQKISMDSENSREQQQRGVRRHFAASHRPEATTQKKFFGLF